MKHKRSKQCDIRGILKHCDDDDCVRICNILGDYFVFEAEIRRAKNFLDIKSALDVLEECNKYEGLETND
jgi:hypothetical protein